uniref:Putative synaptic vesicle transporter svop n=1 Tax=Ixodes ricinus TaxID=34613 RepID=A0A0K8RGT8_IXORI
MSLGTTKYLKRIPIMAGSYGFFGVTLVATAFTPKALSTLRITIRMMGWLVYTLGYTTQFIYINEVNPTVARSGAFGLCTTFGRLGATLEPWIYIATQSWGNTLVLIIYSVMILAIAALVTLLPETFGSVLTDTLEEGERYSETKLSKKKSVQDHVEHLEAYKKVATEDGEAEIRV